MPGVCFKQFTTPRMVLALERGSAQDIPAVLHRSIVSVYNSLPLSWSYQNRYALLFALGHALSKNFIGAKNETKYS
jgi:hypothetical protein